MSSRLTSEGVGYQYSIRIWESDGWQTRTAECRQKSANPLPRKLMVGRLGVADPLFVPLATRGADPRSESTDTDRVWHPTGIARSAQARSTMATNRAPLDFRILPSYTARFGGSVTSETSAE